MRRNPDHPLKIDLYLMDICILIAQLNFLVGDLQGNTDRIIQTAREARQRYGADLVLFPELALTGYPPEDLLLRPEFLDKTARALQKILPHTREIALLLGYPKSDLGGRFNVAGLLAQGRIVAEYAKQALPNYGVFDEKRYFQPGGEPKVIEFLGTRLGITICEDIWEEEPARRAAEAGAQVLLNLNASPYRRGKADARESLVCLRAGEHQIPILYANLVGGQDELVFDGGSFAVDETGALRQRAPFFQEALLPVRFQLAPDGTPRLQPAEIAPAPPELQGIYEALVLGVRDYVHKNGFRGAVLGLSGGIDSALTLALAVDALGSDQVEAVLMPSRYTAAMSVEDAVTQARALSVAHHILPIEPAFQAFLEILAESFAGSEPDVTEENIQARCRGVILMALSNKTGRILLTTGNKSEMAVGYATLYGDMAGGFAPLKDVPKTLVYQLARYRNSISPVIPQRVLERPPSAELRPDQRDQDSLPDYDLLDGILARYIERDESVDQIIAAGFPRAVVEQVARMVDRNEYKRRQAPPGVRITQRAFGRDRRYPITNGFC